MFNLVQRLKARGVPVDGIGAQAHLIVGSVPSTIATNWAQFATLDVDIHVTELDIRMVSFPIYSNGNPDSQRVLCIDSSG